MRLLDVEPQITRDRVVAVRNGVKGGFYAANFRAFYNVRVLIQIRETKDTKA